MSESKDKFSATEVGTILESMNRKFDIILENVLPLRQNIAEVKAQLTNLETRFTLVEDTVRVAIPELFRRVQRLETKVGI